MINQILIFILPLLVTAAQATEIDNTTSFYQPIADSEAVLNAKVQELIIKSRALDYGCNRRVLARQASAELVGNIIFGTVEYFANNSDQVARAYTPVEKSIYRGTPYQGGIVDTFVNLGPTVNVAGIHVGTDKLGHFFDMGYDLYQRSLRGHSIADLLAQSRREQSGLWGALTTGVKSYGDIASNFDGYRFWKEFSEEGPGAYFICEGGRFKQVRVFTWSDYVSDAWSEAINCSEYWSKAYTDPIARNVRSLEVQSGRRYACPIFPERCEVLRDHYASWIPRDQINQIISPLCR